MSEVEGCTEEEGEAGGDAGDSVARRSRTFSTRRVVQKELKELSRHDGVRHFFHVDLKLRWSQQQSLIFTSVDYLVDLYVSQSTAVHSGHPRTVYLRERSEPRIH